MIHIGLKNSRRQQSILFRHVDRMTNPTGLLLRRRLSSTRIVPVDWLILLWSQHRQQISIFRTSPSLLQGLRTVFSTSLFSNKPVVALACLLFVTTLTERARRLLYCDWDSSLFPNRKPSLTLVPSPISTSAPFAKLLTQSNIWWASSRNLLPSITT